MPFGLLLCVDSLWFLGFVALLIVNGAMHEYRWNDAALIEAYATIPWMASS